MSCSVVFCHRPARRKRLMRVFVVRDFYCQFHHEWDQKDESDFIPADHPDAVAARRKWREAAADLMARARR